MGWHTDTHSVSSPSPRPPLFVTLYFPGATSPVPALIDHSYPVSLVNEKLLNKLPCLRELNVYPPAHSSPIYPLGCIITASHFLDPAFPVSCEFHVASDIEPLVILGNDYLSRLASLYDFHIVTTFLVSPSLPSYTTLYLVSPFLLCIFLFFIPA